MDENVDWMKLTSIIKKFSKAKSPFLYVYVYFKTLNNLSNCTLEKNTSPICILCTQMPRTIPLLTLPLVRTLYEESTP